MGYMLRSDKMSYYDIYVQPECAFEVFSRLGEMGCVQFEDMNTDVQPFQKRYILDVCRCAEMERKLRYMEDEMIKDHMYVPEVDNERSHMALQPSEMTSFESTLEKWETDIQEISSNHTKLMTHVLELTEMYYVLSHVGSMLGDAELRRDSFLLRKSELGATGSLWVFTGVVLRSRCFHFEMMLWRVSSGNIFFRQAAEDKILVDTQTGQEVRKVAFLCICHGETLKLRLEKVCAGFRVNIYACPKTLGERMEVIDKLDTRLSDLQQVVTETSLHRCKALRTVGKQWRVWTLQVKKAKAVYHTMNLLTLDITKKCLIGQCWVPDTDAPKVQEMLDEVSTQMDTAVPSFMSKSETTQTPPTFHRTNKFTSGFQNLINAYGNSTYREINPGLFTVITFPFLFSIMFADVGHGVIIVLFAVWMIKIEKECMDKKSNNEIWNIFFGGRYIILLMGLFAMYTGVIFNEWFSRSVMFMPPHWKNHFTADELGEHEAVTLDPKLHTTSPYIFSVDPIWRLSSNKILFENSIKMKLSIIFGVIHMIFGLSMCVFNNLYFKHTYAIFLEFIPQLVFLVVLFFWLVFLIYYKWIFYSGITTDIKSGAGCAPQILIIFIDMVLMAETVAPEDDCDAYMFENQKHIQRALVFVAGVCVPIMLFGPPVYKNYLNKRKSRLSKKNRKSRNQIDQPEVKENEHEAFSEMMIHQAIHTIEYVLSTISHTASYLRLWALSLAHAQLSEMLWDMVLAKLALKKHHSSIAFLWIFIIFGVWAVFTLSILVLMEGLSAFLHTLRLHWVEFMSKFYAGTGYTFRPFSFRTIFEGGDNKLESACTKKKKPTDLE